MMPVVWVTANGDMAVHGNVPAEEDARRSHPIV